MFVSYGLNAASQFVSVYESQNKLNSLSYFGGFIDWPCRRKLSKKQDRQICLDGFKTTPISTHQALPPNHS